MLGNWGRAYQTWLPQLNLGGPDRGWLHMSTMRQFMAATKPRLCHQVSEQSRQTVEHLYRTRSPTPPPGLSTGKPFKHTKLQRAAADILPPAWENFEALRSKLVEVGINPTPNRWSQISLMSSRRTWLVFRHQSRSSWRGTKPQPQTEKDTNFMWVTLRPDSLMQ